MLAINLSFLFYVYFTCQVYKPGLFSLLPSHIEYCLALTLCIPHKYHIQFHTDVIPHGKLSGGKKNHHLHYQCQVSIRFKFHVCFLCWTSRFKGSRRLGTYFTLCCSIFACSASLSLLHVIVFALYYFCFVLVVWWSDLAIFYASFTLF